MNSEVNLSHDEYHIKTTNYKSNRRIYSRDDLFRYYYCTEEIPDYLKEFQYLYNNFTEDNWCKKSIPKFEITETKGKPAFTGNKLKARQRTLSNQSGDNSVEFSETYSKQRSYTSSNGKSNRYSNSPQEMRSTEDIKSEANSKFINSDDFVDNNEAQWHKVESRAIRTFNSSKPYAQNIHLTENHWKKWSKDTNQIGDKNRPHNVQQNRQERNSDIWIRKSENPIRPRNTKSYSRHSVSKSGDQTEDIWQDDWDTEMKSEIAKETDEMMLDSYEFPKSSVLPITPPPVESEQKSPIFDKSLEPPNSIFDMWFYRDLSDIVRGPFSSENMANWLATGYFNPSTFVRRSCDERFLLLAEYRALYGRIPFTAGPTISPIHINTPIEIDVKQLLIGVEMNLIQKVISCATTLPTITQPPILHNTINNTMMIDENIQISSSAVEMMAIMEEKRILEESRAELERERERMIQEKEQWRERIEAEFKAKMEQMMLEQLHQQSLINTVNVEKAVTNVEIVKSLPLEAAPIPLEQPTSEPQQVIEHVVEEIEHEVVIPKQINTKPSNTSSIEKWEIDTEQIPQMFNNSDNNLWISKKDVKRQKQNKKPKSQENKNSKEEKETAVQIPEAKHPDQPTDSRLSFISKETLDKAKKETVAENKGRPIRIELDNHKNDSTTSWNTMPSTNVPTSQISTKSILEIQAEEFEKEKIEKESKNILPDENEVKGKNAKVENSKRKNDVSSTWNQSPLSPNSNVPTITKSLVEIQAEEFAKEKKQQEMQNVVVSANKATSFKESLLKSAKMTSKQPIIPVGKSIWDMIPTESPITTTKPVPTPETVNKKSIEVKSSTETVKTPIAKKSDKDSDQLTDWCVKKLGRFSNQFDVLTVIELLKQVPNEEVMELAQQLIDDSKFTSNFVVEFINKKQELSDKQTEDSWHTVKKSITATTTTTTTTTPVSSSKGKSGKSKSKKKMIVLDPKFR